MGTGCGTSASRAAGAGEKPDRTATSTWCAFWTAALCKTWRPTGTAELAAWDRGELFQFRRDTTDWCGRLADLLPPEEPGDARRALHQGACGLYHLCCHNFLHGRSREAAAEACKAAVFLLQAKLYAEQGLYCRRRSDLEQHLTGQDLEILQTAQALKAGECREDLTALTDRLFAWCRDVIGQQKAI